jgi:hypothetical protein
MSSYRAKIERASTGSRLARFSVELHKVFKLGSFIFELISSRAKKRVHLERLTSLELFLQPYLRELHSRGLHVLSAADRSCTAGQRNDCYIRSSMKPTKEHIQSIHRVASLIIQGRANLHGFFRTAAAARRPACLVSARFPHGERQLRQPRAGGCTGVGGRATRT